jgi:hypothetical protein
VRTSLLMPITCHHFAYLKSSHNSLVDHYPSTSLLLATMRFSKLVVLVIAVSPVASFVLPSRKQAGGRGWRNAEDRHDNSKLHVSPIMDVATAVADGSVASAASAASAIELGSLPLLLAPLAALAAGRQALVNRDAIESMVSLSEEALEQTKKQLEDANKVITVSVSLVDGQLVGCILSLRFFETSQM